MATITTLGYVGAAALQAVARQIDDPASYVDQRTAPRARIAGIEVVQEDLAVSRKQRLQTYQADATELEARLAKAGVSHLAILPTSAWNRIAKESQLFRFKPNAEGKVLASDAVIHHVGAKARQALAWQPLALLSAGLLLGGALGVVLGTALAWGIVVTIALAVFGACVGGQILGEFGFQRYCAGDNPEPRMVAKVERRMIASKLRGRSKRTLLATLWPAGTLVTKGVPIKIGLPPAPPDAQANLIAADRAGFELSLDTVAEAVTFEESPVNAFVEHRSSHWKDEEKADKRRREAEQVKELERTARNASRRRQFLASLDPIVTTSYGSATAIIVQYGALPLEQAIVDRVVNSEHLV